MQKKAVTLIELIVSMTIAMLLMVSIGVFVNSGMRNLFLQQKSLENMSDIADFSNNLRKNLAYANNTGQIEIIGSGIIFKRQKEFDLGGFAYIGTSEEENLFCSGSDVENNKTNHIFIKNFIAYFEKGENKLEQTLTGSLGDYISYQKEHKITKNGEIVVGKGVFGDEFKSGNFGTGIYLNSPTGMAKINSKLYFSDTLNNRVLYLSGSRVYKFLDEYDGISEPTGLFYDTSEKALYLSNSAKGEILKITSKKYSSGELLSFSGSFSPENDVSYISKMEVNFLNSDGGSVDLKLPTSTGSFSFSSNISQNEDFLTGSTNNLTYYFSDYKKILESLYIENCTSEGNTTIKPAYLDTDGQVKKQIQECKNEKVDKPDGTPKMIWKGTETTYGSQNNISLNSSQNYNIEIKNIEITENTTPGNYYVELKFLDKDGKELYSKYLPFFVNGDGKIETIKDNTIEIYKNNLKYPNGIWGNSDFNEFKDYSHYDLKIDKKNDIVLKTPIKDLEISETENKNLINFILKYYKNYNCYNLDENSGKIATFLLKKNLK